ncbi:RNA-binding protein [Candidatus Woesearchaeota archaeon CG11_big_fil_rev_8_21_14_0_20_43_8]|nr:MAG: RNA-binding protein [Candidatus Woesearchaeota archaeon CG11_big_fil_rev_8_21_14_0_20_43_8]
MTDEIMCSSCKRRVTNMVGTTHFKCPKCGEVEIVRCTHCRELASKYKCHGCGFEGPN